MARNPAFHKLLDEIKEMPLVNNRGIAIVDAEDYHILSQHNWCLHSQGYAMRSTTGGKTYLMHRIILGDAVKDLSVDHINGDKLDNRRSNLRACTHKQNTYNRGVQKNNRYSIYKGVTRDSRLERRKESSKTWLCALNRRQGHAVESFRKWFYTEEGAALAYNVIAKRWFGEFAYLNEVTDA